MPAAVLPAHLFGWVRMFYCELFEWLLLVLRRQFIAPSTQAVMKLRPRGHWSIEPVIRRVFSPRRPDSIPGQVVWDLLSRK
jgi:hypothetical protein